MKSAERNGISDYEHIHLNIHIYVYMSWNILFCCNGWYDVNSLLLHPSKHWDIVLGDSLSS